MRGRAHSDEIRAAVMAALLEGQSVASVATKFKIDKSLVSRWKSAMPEQLQQLATQKSERLEELLFAGLESNLQAQQAITSAVADASYIKQQPASEVAVLYGVLADKSIRLLEAAFAGSSADEGGGMERG